MYSRPRGDRIKIPENYSGHAFRDQSPYGDMPPPTHIPASPPKKEKAEPSRSETYVSHQSSHAQVDEREAEEINSQEYFEKEATSAPEAKPTSIFSSLLPTSTSCAGHFPFGHGIGSEEILILAVMLLVFLSEESDHELLLLLGFLLFAG